MRQLRLFCVWLDGGSWDVEKEPLKRKSSSDSSDSSGDEDSARPRKKKSLRSAKSTKRAKGANEDRLPEWTKKRPDEIM